jgi:hypothetical protein
MLPEEQDIVNKMKGASLAELYPGFDKEGEWATLNARLKGNTRPLQLGGLKAAAAALILLVCGGVAWYKLQPPADSTNNAAVVANADTQRDEYVASIGGDNQQGKNAMLPGRPLKTKVPVDGAGKSVLNASAKATDPICNATDCALEICIYQTKKCGNDKPKELSDCRTLEPEQSGQLKYTPPEPDGKGCMVTVDELRITRVSTGESIVISADSGRVTPEEVLRCLTGEASCNMLAGMFEKDCSNELLQGKLKIDSRDGDVIIR